MTQSLTVKQMPHRLALLLAKPAAAETLLALGALVASATLSALAQIQDVAAAWKPTAAGVVVILIIYAVRGFTAWYKTRTDHSIHTTDLQASQWKALIDGYVAQVKQLEETHTQAFAEQRTHYLQVIEENRKSAEAEKQQIRDGKHAALNRANEKVLQFNQRAMEAEARTALILDRAGLLGYDVAKLSEPAPAYSPKER